MTRPGRWFTASTLWAGAVGSNRGQTAPLVLLQKATQFRDLSPQAFYLVVAHGGLILGIRRPDGPDTNTDTVTKTAYVAG